MGRYPAVELFVTRARVAQPGFVLVAGGSRAVAGICARLDGLPLAIELAAVRSDLFTPDELLARLSSSLPVLAAGWHDLPPAARRSGRRWPGAMTCWSWPGGGSSRGSASSPEAAEATCAPAGDSGTGVDYLYAGDHDDFLYGNEDRDYLFGEDGNDYMECNLGADIMYGSSGLGTMYGDAGDEVVCRTTPSGGTGALMTSTADPATTSTAAGSIPIPTAPSCQTHRRPDLPAPSAGPRPHIPPLRPGAPRDGAPASRLDVGAPVGRDVLRRTCNTHPIRCIADVTPMVIA